MIGFAIWSIVAIIFIGIGAGCRKSREAAGFFTFVKAPEVGDVRKYNRALSVLWFVAAGVLEIVGIPLLFLEQNSPGFIFIIFAVVILMIGMMIGYFRIEARYRK